MTGAAYVLAKYGSKGAGDLVWLVYASGGDVLELPGRFNQRGLSHISLFTTFTLPTAIMPVSPVPDHGGTLMLLGGSLVGLAFLRWAHP
jgi:hypothetical protein